MYHCEYLPTLSIPNACSLSSVVMHVLLSVAQENLKLSLVDCVFLHITNEYRDSLIKQMT